MLPVKRKCFFNALFLFAGVMNNGVTANGQTVTVMTYNIRHASPPSYPNKIDVDTVAGVIKKHQPDIVALQEVDVYTGRSGKELHEAQAIAEKAGLHASFGKTINFSGGAYGIAVLSKYPIDSSKTMALPSANDKTERRALQLTYLRLPGDTKLVFACTHLDAESSDESRLLQMATIDSVLVAIPYPVLLAGDFNAEPESQVIKKLDKHFQRSCMQDCGHSFSSDHPEKTIDYIAGRKSDGFILGRHQVLPEAYPSDHLAVMAEVIYPSSTNKSKKRKDKR